MEVSGYSSYNADYSAERRCMRTRRPVIGSIRMIMPSSGKAGDVVGGGISGDAARGIVCADGGVGGAPGMARCCGQAIWGFTVAGADLPGSGGDVFAADCA